MKKILAFGPLFVIIAALLWSADGLLRMTLYTLPPSVLVFFEHSIGFMLLLPLFFLWMKDLRLMSKKEWLAITVVAIFSGALGTILYTTALQHVQYSSYSVVVLLQQQLQPIWAILTAALLLKERITKKFLLWAGLALLGAYFISFKDLTVNLSTGAGTATAAGLALGAGVLWGSSTAISKYVLKKVSFLTGVALRFFLAPIFALLLIVGQGKTAALSTITLQQFFMLFIIALSTGMVALGFYYYGLKRTPARITTLCELVWPASAICIDWFAYHKALSITQVIGVALLLLAIYKVTQPTRTESVDLDVAKID